MMKKYDEIYEGQILYTAQQEEFYEHGNDNPNPEGILPKHTKLIVDHDDSPEVFFKVLEGKFKDKIMMWGWYGDSSATPNILLTEEEYASEVGGIVVNDENKAQIIGELMFALSGVDIEKFELLIQYYENKTK